MKLINLQVHSKEECEDDYFSADAARDAGMKPNDLRKQIPQVRYILLLRGHSQTTLTKITNYQPPTYPCLHWLTFELPPTYHFTCQC